MAAPTAPIGATALERALRYTAHAVGVAAGPPAATPQLVGAAPQGAARVGTPLFRPGMAISARRADALPGAATREPTASGAPGEHASSDFLRLLSVAGAIGPPVALAGPPAGAAPLPAPALVRVLPVPTPCPDSLEVDFRLTEPADVQLDLLDARGRKVLGVIRRGLASGCPHRILLTLAGLGLPPAAYTCRLQVLGARGTLLAPGLAPGAGPRPRWANAG